MASMHPEIDFKHVLSELSVNRRYPCEVIRELISNSYDARAQKIEIYPLPQKRGFIFFDDGDGLSEQTAPGRPAPPYVAFFSIGRTTKTKGEGIGYKCQGTKLCFAAGRFAVVTRCEGEASFRFKLIENPRSTLDSQYDISPEYTTTPWQKLAALLEPLDERSKSVVDHLGKAYFKNFVKGTMVIVLEYDVEDFNSYFTVNGAAPEASYLCNYIRSCTRHGDVRILNQKMTGFSADAQNAFRYSPGYNDKCRLGVWVGSGFHQVSAGYFWLNKPDQAALIKDPHEIARLRDGTFWDRHAQMIEHAGRKYAFILAIDGNNRALRLYEHLDRRGKTISGIRLTDQRGAFISCNGIKIGTYNELFSHGKMEERYAILATGEAQSHYLFVIDGAFDLVTNRNDLAEDAIKLLRSDAFVEKIKAFLDTAYYKKTTFQRLLDRLRKESVDVKRELQTQQAEELKGGISQRTRFRILNVPALKDKWFVAPLPGEEHWVGALYTLFSHLVPSDSPYAHLWSRTITFSSRGIDSLAIGTGGSLKKDDLCAIEYKYAFDGSNSFNHPLTLTDQIVCWSLVIPDNGVSVQDDYDCFGTVHRADELEDLGFKVKGVTSRSGDSFGREVMVLGLRHLLKKTFTVEEQTPPPPLSSAGGGKNSKR
ncbi:ATP-binding protein [Stigmatella hybrida]|uniref:ATP-binding protein n=1 Tax=Stigmatella hybrida TaxID=394097 RepID=UPI001CDA712D|nr:ATP-binding protein [Stigmatella hybrida]